MLSRHEASCGFSFRYCCYSLRQLRPALPLPQHAECCSCTHWSIHLRPFWPLKRLSDDTLEKSRLKVCSSSRYRCKALKPTIRKPCWITPCRGLEKNTRTLSCR